MSEPALDDIRLITVRPPWSFAIAHLGKRVENRTRSTSYRGAVGIHAGRQFDRTAAFSNEILSAAYVAGGGVLGASVIGGLPELMLFGQVVALAELVDCHPDDGTCCGVWAQRSHTTDGAGRTVIHHLVLEDVRPLTDTIRARGQLGLPWRPDPALLAALHATPQAAERRQRTVVTEPAPAQSPTCGDDGLPTDVHTAHRFSALS